MTLGAGLGLFAALGLGRLARSQLFGVEGLQPLLLFAAAAGTSIVAFAAGAIPAWRAARVDPIVALRTE